MTILLHQNLERAAQALPEQTAFVCGRDRLTWRQLDEQSTAFAVALQHAGVTPGDHVAICADLSLPAVIAIYGCLKAGAVYVPVDHSSSDQRLCALIEECDATVLVITALSLNTRHTLETHAPSLRLVVSGENQPEQRSRLEVVCFSGFLAASGRDPFVRPATTPRQPAYVIFTSGSTGRPKGIVHTHQSAGQYAELTATAYRLSSADMVAGVCPLHFDMSTFALFASVHAAARTVLIPAPVLRFPASFALQLEQHRVSVLYCVPYLLIQLLERGVLDQRLLDSLRWIVFAGETFPLRSLQDLRSRLCHVAFSNAYGPAETNVCCVRHFVPWQECAEPDRSEIPIGRPWGDGLCRVVDADDVVVEPGEAGELLVSSGTVMSHYLGHSADDQPTFCFCPATGRRFYRTGDVVRQNADGELVFVGRQDRQVKVRGHRVELDAVENAMTRFPGVLEASVSCVPADGSQQLHAVYTSVDRQALDAPLQRWLQSELPRWAVPSVIQRVPTFARTTSGKIDHRRQGQQMAAELTTHNKKES
ncbi:MAG: amino acid adenylation domain-containing protein [Planctomycetaceae bacterium]|nr:amino acid adenylation domain-containing protein [Planctomycetaceae bacterium]